MRAFFRICTAGAVAAVAGLAPAQVGTTWRVSVSSAGVEASAPSYKPSINADGRYVAFYSEANNLVSGDSNNRDDIFVRDLQSNTTQRVSLNTAGTQGNNHSNANAISANGLLVAFNILCIKPGDRRFE